MLTLAVWWRHPGFRLLFPYILGLILSKYSNHDGAVALPVFLLGAIAAISIPRIFRSHNLRYGIGLVSIIALICSGISFSKLEKNTSVELHETGQSLCVVQDYPVETPKTYRVQVRIYEVDDGGMIGGGILYVKKCDGTSQLKPGSLISYLGEWEAFEKPKNPSQFNIAAFYAMRDIHWRAFADTNNIRVIDTKLQRDFRMKIGQWRREALMMMSDNGLTGEVGAIAGALVLGDKSELPKEIMDDFAAAGVVHVLCVSGMHVGVIFMMISFMFGFLKKGRLFSTLRFLIPVLAVWSYSALTGFSPSVVRASVLITISMGAIMLGRRSDRLGVLMMAAFLILLVEPTMLFMTGFQLSFLAVMGIVMASKIGKLPINKVWLVWLVESLIVSLAAQAFTTPLSMMLFHRFPTYFLLSNLFIVPLATISLWLCSGSLAISFIPIVSKSLAWMASQTIGLMLWLVQVIRSLPMSSIERIHITIPTLIIAYMLIILVWAWLSFKDARLLKYFMLVVGAMAVLNLHQAIRVRSQEEIWIYSLGAYTAIDIFQGNKVVHLNAIPPDKTDYLKQSSIEPLRISKGIQHQFCLGPPVEAGSCSRAIVGGVVYGIINYPDKWTNRLVINIDADVLVIGGLRVPDTLTIDDCPKHLVVADTRKVPVIECEDSELRTHYLREGAFRIDPRSFRGEY